MTVILMMLDSSTMLFVVMALFVVLSGVVWFSLHKHHNAAVAFWCAGSLLAALSLLFMALREHVPSWLTHHVANAGLAFVFVLWAQGMRVLRRSGWPIWVLPLAFAACLFFYGSLFIWGSANTRGLGMRLLLMLLAAWVALESWWSAKQLQTSNAYPIAGAMALMSVVLLAQAVLGGGGGPMPSPFSNTWNASMLAGVALLVALITHLSFVGIIIELALRQELKHRTEAMSLQHAGLLDSQLLSLERQRRMMLVSGALAHELNQPLTVALTNAQLMHRLMESGKLVSDTLAELLSKMTLGIERAVAILQRIREIEPNADVEVRLEQHDLCDLSKQAIEHLQHDLQTQGISVRLVHTEQPVLCKVDSILTSQILVNLLRNAIQAMQDQKTKSLLLTCQVNDDRVWIEISDSGSGLPSHIEREWGQAFLTTREEGLGLGLTISKTLAQQMGGTLELRNRHAAGGAVATLSFVRVKA